MTNLSEIIEAINDNDLDEAVRLAVLDDTGETDEILGRCYEIEKSCASFVSDIIFDIEECPDWSGVIDQLRINIEALPSSPANAWERYVADQDCVEFMETSETNDILMAVDNYLEEHEFVSGLTSIVFETICTMLEEVLEQCLEEARFQAIEDKDYDLVERCDWWLGGC